MSLLRASDLLQLQFQVSHPAIMHRTKMLVKRRGVFAVQRTKMNLDQILSVDKLVTLLSVWRNLNLILHHISWCISCKIDPDFSHRGREDKKLKKKPMHYMAPVKKLVERIYVQCTVRLGWAIFLCIFYCAYICPVCNKMFRSLME